MKGGLIHTGSKLSDFILADLMGRGRPSVPGEKAGCDRAQRGHVDLHFNVGLTYC